MSSVIGPEPKASHAHFRRGRENSLFISGKSLGNVIRVGLRKVMPKGVRVRPHTLRAWTSTQLELAERQGKITRSLREYFLGHNLKSVELRYNLGKKLSPENLEELRSAYKRCDAFLSTVSVAESNDGATRVLRALLVSRGHPKEEAEKLDIDGMSDQELEALFKKLGQGSSSAKRSEKAVAVDDVPKMLDAGWEFVAPLNGSMTILRSP